MEGILNKHFSLVHNIYIYILLAVALLLLILFPVYIKEDGASAVTGTATASSTSLTIASGKNTASVAITPTNASGAFATSSSVNKAEFNVSTNNYTGYTLTITASDDTGNLVNTTTNGTIASITTNLTESSFNTSTYNNKWGFKPSRYVSNNTVITNTGDGSVYLPSPTTSGIVLDHTSGANSAANNYTIALGIRADSNTKSGTYSKTFTLVATANPSTYAINYNKNTTDSVSNMPSTSTAGSTTSTSITLPSTVPTRAHYSFLGWCSTTTATSNGVDSCSGTVYNPNGAGTNLTYGLDQTTANTTTLYAMWELEKFTITLATTGGANGIIIDGVNYSGPSASLAYGNYTISGSYASGYEFDSWATSGSISVASTSSASTTLTISGAGTLTLSGKQSCVTISGYLQDFTGTANYCATGTLTDSRDGEVYNVGKLADGRWWLLDNLRLDLSTTRNLTTANTNITSNWTAPTDIATWSNGADVPKINTASKDATQTYGSGSGKIGVYYNYCAATAGTYCYSSSAGTGGNATSDICPKGWRMPTGDSSGEYQALYTAYSSNNANFMNALRTPLSGYFYYGSVSSQGSYGYFWSSTSYDKYYMYYMSVHSSDVRLRSNERNYGNSVRCVLQSSDISQISTMQDFATNNATAIKNSMTAGQAYTLTDSRDGETYSVAKLADGNVWLLDNLRLNLSTTRSLTTANTNIASNWTAPTNITIWSNVYDAPKINTASKDATQSYGSGSGKIGVYYNYCAATAGTYCYAGGAGTGNATSDICPKGWRMPTGGTSGEYQALYTAYSSNATNFKNALRTPLSGLFYSGSTYSQGSYGYFWSSTYNDSNSMYYLNVNSSNVISQYYISRFYGFSVRCLLQ